MNLGFVFYIKEYKIDSYEGYDKNSIDYKINLMKDPLTGADLDQVDVFLWHDSIFEKVSALYKRAMTYGKYDSEYKGYYY